MTNEVKTKVQKYEDFIEVLREAQLILGEYVKAVKEADADVVMNPICLEGYLLCQCDCQNDPLDEAYSLLHEKGYLDMFGEEGKQ